MDDKEFLKLLINNRLNHTGILGMKWGRRKARDTSLSSLKTYKPSTKVDKVLSSPTRLYLNRKKFSSKDISKAMERMRLERDLRNLSSDSIGRGNKFASTFVAYGTTLATAYGVYKSPLGQAIATGIKAKFGVSLPRQATMWG